MQASQPWMRSLTGQVAAPAVQYHWKPRYRRSTPTLIVVDASVVAAALSVNGHDGNQARNRLRGERLTAPELVDLETASVWRRQVREGVMDARRAALALADLAALPLRRGSHRPPLPPLLVPSQKCDNLRCFLCRARRGPRRDLAHR